MHAARLCLLAWIAKGACRNPGEMELLCLRVYTARSRDEQRRARAFCGPRGCTAARRDLRRLAIGSSATIAAREPIGAIPVSSAGPCLGPAGRARHLVAS
eukprot:4417978-Pleurochrysis_carterae.AAC.1